MWILFLMLFCTVAQADVYVLTNSDNSVVGLSEQNDMIAPKGDTIAIIKGNIANLPITGSPQLYNFSKGAFTLNTAAVQAQQKAEQDAIATQTASDQNKASAIAKLADAISKVEPKDLLTDEEIKALLSANGN